MAGLHDEPRSADATDLEFARHSEGQRIVGVASGFSVSIAQRVWRAFGLPPHRIETFKLSTDPNFVATSKLIRSSPFG